MSSLEHEKHQLLMWHQSLRRGAVVGCVVGCLAICSVVVSALAQEPAPGPRPAPRIEGPTMTPVGAELRLSVTGLTTPPLSEGIGKLQEWSQKVSLIVDAPDGATAIADTDLSLGLGAQAVRFRVFFTPSAGGVYLLIVHDANAGVIATKRITVGPVVPPVNPQPGPGPGPSPGPTNPAKLTQLVLVYEKDQSTISPAIRAAFHKVNVDGSGVVASVLEVDSTNGGGSIPKQYAAAVKAARDAGLPALVAVAGDVVVRTVKNPTTEAHVTEALGK